MRLDGLNVKNPALQGMGDVTPLPKGDAKGGDFSKVLMDVLKDVNATQQDAVKTQQALMTGQSVDYHDLMIAMEKASTAMQLTMAVRNKILEAYQEISHMQV